MKQCKTQMQKMCFYQEKNKKKKPQHDNLEVAFITNDQTFQLFNKQG